MFLLDTRESELIQRIPDAIVKQLPVGDIWIGTNDQGILEGGLIIERKSIRDLEASILDGRYKEQRGRILSLCQENKSQPMYILEGSLASGSGRLQKKALMKFIHRLIFHYQIPVMQTQSIQETAELVQTLIEQWKDDPASLQRTTELVKVTDGIHIQKKVNASDPTQFAIACLAQCPGVSVKMAEQLVQTFGTFQGILNASSAELEAVKVGARKLGPVVSKRLHELLHT
uniref:ERCC4 domain-containing protein n=1 Tax=viral metagenome TaxID=1070528 RepID=A0A6C0KVM1_9ZZZZ